MKKWFQPEFWSDPKLSIHAIHLKNEETTSTFATYWILKNHAYNQEIERAKRKIEKKIRRFFREKPNSYVWSQYISRDFAFSTVPCLKLLWWSLFLFICFMISSFKKYCPNSLCVVCPKRKRKSKFRVFQQKLLTILIRLPVYMTHYLLILLFAFCISFIPSFHYFLSPR